MSFTWHRPDGSSVAVEDAQPLLDELQELRSRYEMLAASNDEASAALVLADHQTVLEDWRELQCEVWKQDVWRLEAIVTMLNERLAWWKELLEDEEPRTELSPAQKVIFANASDEPRSWEHARRGLYNMENFRPPLPSQLPDAIRSSERMLEAAREWRIALLEAARSLKEIDLNDSQAWLCFSEVTMPALRSRGVAYSKAAENPHADPEGVASPSRGNGRVVR